MLSPEDYNQRALATPASEPRWPERIIELSRRWADDPSASRELLLGKTWELFNMALLNYLRLHRKRYEYGDEDDLYDIAAQKSLELLNKIDRRQWNPADSSPAQLCSFVSTLARNGLIDHLRVIGSKRPRSSERPGNDVIAAYRIPDVTDPATTADRDEFVSGIRACVQAMQPRIRTVWFLRVLLDMPAKEIARHPAVDMRPGTIDVTLSRCRDLLTRCMKHKGYDATDMPAGTFSQLWRTFEGDLRLLMNGEE